MPEVHLTGENWENKLVANILGGLVLDRAGDQLQDNQFNVLDGVIYDKTKLKKDTGYVDLGVIPSGNPGIFRRTFKHVTQAGVTNVFAVTNNTFLLLSSGNWVGVSNGGGNTTLSANASGGATSITVAAITNFADNDTIAITLDDGSTHVTTVNGTPAGSTINFDDALPGSGVVATSGNAVIECLTLAGTLDKHVFGVTVPWNDWLAFTNGIDFPQYYDPATTQVQVIPNLPSSGNTICESIVLFDNSLVLVRTTEGGAQFNQRLRWSDRADGTNWTTGESGSIDLLDSSDFIQNALLLGPFLIVYREKTIYRGEAVNTTTKRFSWNRTISNEGIISPAAVVDIKVAHFAVGNEEIFLYTGGFTIKPIGLEIKDTLLGPSADADKDNLHKAFCTFIKSRDEVLITYQTTAATTSPNKTLRWHTKLNAWQTRSFTDELVGDGEVTQTNSFTWNDLIGSWQDQTWQWNSSFIGATFSTVALCAADGGVHEYDFLTAADDGTTVSWEIQTPDFGHPNGQIRVDYIDLGIGGGDFTLEASLDMGDNWTTIGTVSPGVDGKRIRVHRQFSGDTIRYRLTGSAQFQFRWYNIRYTIETED